MCYNIINKSPKKIGGIGHIVEIDETMVYRRKYNRGRLTSNQREQVWVFGGVDRISKLAIAEVVDKRNEATLLKILKEKSYLELQFILMVGRAIKI